MAISIGGAAMVAALPKVLDLVMGDKIARRKKEVDAEEAYRQAVFLDATAVRARESATILALQQRNRELEDALVGRRSP